MKKAILFFIVCALLAAGGAYGGYRYIQEKDMDSGTKNVQDFQRNKPPVSGVNNGLSRGSRSDGMAAGEIFSIEADNFTLKLSKGGSKIIFYSNETKISVYQDIADTGLAVGDKAVVAGYESESGTLTAISVQVGSPSAMAGMANRQSARQEDVKNAGTGDNGDSRDSKDQKTIFFTGEITSVGNGKISLKNSDGEEKNIEVSDKTKYSRITDSLSDSLASGKFAMVAGPANSDGSISAKLIQIRPKLPEISGEDRPQSAKPSDFFPDDKNEDPDLKGTMSPGN
ncbi:MAG TPA: DUF5666 domain-containing protein [Candidatus Paceibacterota bacterium]|nr:DUF5666 domain-containing protein [Candidatus Pacearchaeota archaeon]HRZ50437.1 DUF5666 domain-containing protein [Candidatus Paceibacterota bacterium]HSA36158.1 DUF5666 domain-containing protein [Candidatus Paceibacterota bacterium]